MSKAVFLVTFQHLEFLAVLKADEKIVCDGFLDRDRWIWPRSLLRLSSQPNECRMHSRNHVRQFRNGKSVVSNMGANNLSCQPECLPSRIFLDHIIPLVLIYNVHSRQRQPPKLALTGASLTERPRKTASCESVLATPKMEYHKAVEQEFGFSHRRAFLPEAEVLAEFDRFTGSIGCLAEDVHGTVRASDNRHAAESDSPR